MARINYTARKRITRQCFDVLVREGITGPILDVHRLDLSDLDLPGSARVVVEAYRGTAYMRFETGTVERLRLPTGAVLREFESIETPRFRIKVVGTDGDSGKLLAVADTIRARQEGEAEEAEYSLLTVVPRDLGSRIWKLECLDDDPKLLVNSELGDWRTVVASEPFEAFVLPEALRQVLDWLLDGLDSVDEEDDSPAAQWLGFVKSLGREPSPEDAEDPYRRDRWLDDVVDHFSSRHQLLRRVTVVEEE